MRGSAVRLQVPPPAAVPARTPRRKAPVPDPDELLVARARRGDLRSVETLLRKHRSRIVSVARRVVGDRDEAEDVAQEALTSIARNLHAFRGGAAFTTWVHRVAVNHALNHLRASARRSRGEGRAAEAEGLRRVPEEGPTAGLEVREDRERVRAAIEALDPVFRSCVLLRDVEGLSYDEIAARTGLPEGTVKSRIHRARRQIRGELAPA